MALYYPLTIPGGDASGSYELTVRIVHHPNSRRLVLRLGSPQELRITSPSSVSTADALAFARRQHVWIAKQIKLRQQAPSAENWHSGTEILFRGERTRLNILQRDAQIHICFADQLILVQRLPEDLRPTVEWQLRRLARSELPPRTLELAKRNRISIGKIAIRSQRTRWGSCSSKRDISLNWRLIQLPPWVRDYIILHELTHCLEMNHSPRFWTLLGRLCPETETARAWLRKHRDLSAL